MLAVLGSAEPAGCHHPAKGPLECCCSHQGSTAQPGDLGSSSWTACSSGASSRSSLEWWSPVGPWWLFHFCCVRGERFLFLSSMRNSYVLLGMCLLSDLLQRCLLTLETLFFCSEWCMKPSVGHFLIIMSICKYSSDKERWASAHPVCAQSLALFPLHQWHRA